MAQERYFCKKCDAVVNIDTRRKNKLCPYCSSDLSQSKMNTWKVVKGTLYRGEWTCTDSKIVIPDGVKEIEHGAFKGSYVKKIVFPKSLEEIPDSCFDSCTSLTEIVIPGNIKRIGYQAFRGCYNLQTVILSEGVTKIASECFLSCSSLKMVTLPDSLVEIGSNAFNLQTKNIEFVSIPKKVKNIGTNAFGWSIYKNDRKEYVIQPDSYAGEYLKSADTEFTVIEGFPGILLTSNIVGNTLYYWPQRYESTVVIPDGVEYIEKYAFYKHTEIKKISFPASLKEIKDSAFEGCSNIKSIHFNDGLTKICDRAFFSDSKGSLEVLEIPSSVKTIGKEAFAGFAIEKLSFEHGIETIDSKAFFNYSGYIVDLPASVKQFAKDAFGTKKDLLISVGGEMPYYASMADEIERDSSQLRSKKKELDELTKRREAFITELDAFGHSPTADFDLIPSYRQKLADITRERDDDQSKAIAERDSLKDRIMQIESELSQLSEQRKKCFFLAVSKKKELDGIILNKQNELHSLQNTLKQQSDDAVERYNRFTTLISLANAELEKLLSSQSAYLTKKRSLTTASAGVEKEVQQISEEIKALEESLTEKKRKLDNAHKKWKKAKDKAGLLAEQQRLLSEKAKILSGLKLPKYDKLPSHKFSSHSSVVEELLLNEAYAELVGDKNEYERIKEYNRYINEHQKQLLRVKEINVALGLSETDGIESFELSAEPKLRSTYMPTRIHKLSKVFGKTKEWQIFKRKSKLICADKMPKSLLNEYIFEGCDSVFAIGNDSCFLVIFPYCTVIYELNKAMSVLTFDRTFFSVQHKDVEVNDDMPARGEIIAERYKYVNQDGSPSKRYKNNPIIRIARFTEIVLSSKTYRFVLPVESFEAALRFEDAYNEYRHVFTDGRYKDIYTYISTSADTEVIENAVDDLANREKKRIELERKLEIEEKERIEAEKLAEKAAAEERRQQIIKRQKEINEERKRQAAEKKKIYSLFEDEPADVEASKAEIVDGGTDAPLEIVGNRLVSNNVFKIKLKKAVTAPIAELSGYFISKDGTVISNKKKISDFAEEAVVGFVLNSGIDYTKMTSCFMCIESDGAILCKIDFKMNISFYSDF